MCTHLPRPGACTRKGAVLEWSIPTYYHCLRRPCAARRCPRRGPWLGARAQVLQLWGAILTAVPNSRLLLKNKPFACEAARAHVLRQLASVGVEAWRVDLLPLAPGNAQHMATYGLMDISLDPFPYAGTYCLARTHCWRTHRTPQMAYVDDDVTGSSMATSSPS